MIKDLDLVTLQEKENNPCSRLLIIHLVGSTVGTTVGIVPMEMAAVLNVGREDIKGVNVENLGGDKIDYYLQLDPRDHPLSLQDHLFQHPEEDRQCLVRHNRPGITRSHSREVAFTVWIRRKEEMVLALFILGIVITNSRIRFHMPWTPWGYSSPLVSTHLYHNFTIRLHKITSGHSCLKSLICCSSQTFLSIRLEGSSRCSEGSNNTS